MIFFKEKFSNTFLTLAGELMKLTGRCFSGQFLYPSLNKGVIFANLDQVRYVDFECSP